jgi:threonine/homoserine efflux transporter RhtA
VVLVSLGAIVAEPLLIGRDLLAAAVAVAVLAVAAEVALQEVLLRRIRQELRGGGGAA